jgi:hypothetical protein
MNKKLQMPANTSFFEYSLVLIPIILFFFTVNYMAVNVPFQDDFDGLLEPTLSLKVKDNSFTEMWNILFTQDDERRIVINRFVSFSILKIFGDLDLKKQIIAGSSTILFCIVLFIKWFKNQNLSWAYLAPISFILFNIQYFDAILWSMIPFQHIGVYVWALGSLYFLNGSKNHQVAISILLAIISLFSDVSGVLLLPVGFFLLGIQRKWKIATLWITILGAVVIYYFYDLTVPGYRPSISSNIAHPTKLLSMYISMLGLWLDPGNGVHMNIRLAVTFIAGFLSLGFIAKTYFFKTYSIWKNHQQLTQNEFLCFGGIGVVASAFFMFVINRSSEGFEAIFITRYHFLYALWAVLCYLLVIQENPKNILKNKFFLPAALILSISYCIFSYFLHWQDMDYFRKMLLTDSYEWKNHKIIPSSPIYIHEKEKVDYIYENAFNSGIYKGVDYPFNNITESKGQPIHVEILDYNYAICILLPEFKRKIGKNDGAYVILKSGSENHIFPTKNNRRSFLSMLKNGSYYNTTAYSIPILKEYLKSTEYELEIGVMENDKMVILETNNKIILSNFQSSNQ